MKRYGLYRECNNWYRLYDHHRKVGSPTMIEYRIKILTNISEGLFHITLPFVPGDCIYEFDTLEEWDLKENCPEMFI